jgi:uncharacterized membrane protein (UPF0127 family)
MLQFLTGVACMLVLASCSGKSEERPGSLPHSHRFTLEVDDKPIAVRIAIRDNEQKTGLMEIDSMPADEGMLFVSELPRQMSFWMRNTRIPLDIGYFNSEGTLLEIYPLYPHVEDPVKSRSIDVRYALEMNQGWFKANGVKVGARLELTALRKAIADRGFDEDVFVYR